MVEHARACPADGAELVVARDLFGDVAALVLLKGDASPEVVDERASVEQPPDQCFQSRRAALFVQGPPRHEAAAPAGDRADAGQHAVRNYQQQVRHEQVGRGVQVPLQLVDCHTEVGPRVRRVL